MADQQIQRSIASSSVIKFECKHGKKTIGRIFLYIINNDLHKRSYGFLEDLFVNEAMRRHGIGKILLEAAIAEAKKRKLYKLIGTSRMARTDVHGFYEHYGFRKYGLEFRMDLE